MLVVVTVVVEVTVLVEVLELVVVEEMIVVLDDVEVVVTVVVELVGAIVVVLVDVDEVVDVCVVVTVVVVVVPPDWIASHNPLTLVAGAFVFQVSGVSESVEATMFQASNFSNAPTVSPATHPVGCVHVGVPPWPMKPNRMSLAFVVDIAHDAGLFAFTITGSTPLGS